MIFKNTGKEEKPMNNIVELLKEYGPLTGKEIYEKTYRDIYELWKVCNNSRDIISRTIGEKYLRFDKHVDGFARLSPSIIREFYSYMVFGTKEQYEMINTKAENIYKEILEISRKKFQLAQKAMAEIVEHQEDPQLIRSQVCFIISGDVAYGMAHTEPRPECSTGKLVNGSDLDIVVVSKDLPDSVIKGLDSSIYEQKAYLLKNPSYREEIDYVVKNISKVEKQLEFDEFESMIASKVLHEGKFLYGSIELFDEIKKMIFNRGIPQKLDALKKKASIDRDTARRQLLTNDNAILDEDNMKLFYTTDEKEEFF